MAVKGLYTAWLSSINKIRENLNGIWLETERYIPDLEAKERIKKKIDIIFYLLSKGRVKNETPNKRQ